MVDDRAGSRRSPDRKDGDKLAVLRKILNLELRGGYRDRAVIGGLDRFLSENSSQLAPVISGMGSYSRLSERQRQRWASELVERLDSAGKTPKEPPRRKERRASPRSRAKGPPDSIARLAIAGGIARYVEQLDRLGIGTIADVIHHFPHRHNDFSRISAISELVHGAEHTIVGRVFEVSEVKRRRGPSATEAIIRDDTGTVRVIWHGQGFLARSLRQDAQVAISGPVRTLKGRHLFESPEYEILAGQEQLVHTGRLVPVYPTTEGLPQRAMRRIVHAALKVGLKSVSETLPPDMIARERLMGRREAISQFHYPDDEETRKAAKRRLAFDEMIILQLAVRSRRRRWRSGEASAPALRRGSGRGLTDAFLASLPFELTGAQRGAISEIQHDLERTRPMVRLLQGDVGSGKTVVALAALLIAVDAGRCGALMAPTEILAEQHFTTVCRLLCTEEASIDRAEAIARVELGGAGAIRVALLTGGAPKSVRGRVGSAIAGGEVDIAIGTHALIQESVKIPRLAVGVVDEQHRFGVMQRAALGEREEKPHLLAMSATPIPRSLGLTVFGDMDISVLEELPPGRKPVKTFLVSREGREKAYDFVRERIEQGEQAFMVFPLIEGSDSVRARAATEEHARLSTDVYPNLRLGLLHGRMKSGEKDDVLERFANREIDILVSTSVIEVGVDFPNATVIVIDGADRFGLAQLHQFRGRVGRGSAQSWCLLMSESALPEATERLRLMEKMSDGFRLAEEDLRLRGPGDYLGTRQSGLPILKIASIFDTITATMARREADRMLSEDPDLLDPKHGCLRLALDRVLADSAAAGE